MALMLITIVSKNYYIFAIEFNAKNLFITPFKYYFYNIFLNKFNYTLSVPTYPGIYSDNKLLIFAEKIPGK